MSEEEINCESCYYDYEKCAEPNKKYQEHYNEESEAEFCKSKGYFLWSPKNGVRKKFCKDCPMFDKRRIKCCRHAEPCFNNKRFYKWKEGQDEI